MLEILVDTVCSTRKQIRIGGQDYPNEVVKSRLLKLDSSHIEYVMDSLHQNTTKVRNIRAYLLTALYNALPQSAATTPHWSTTTCTG